MSKRTPKRIVFEFDVTGLSRAQIGALENAAIAQAEASDGEGGKRYIKGQTEGHPDVLFLETTTVKRGKRTIQALKFNITDFTKQEIGYFASEVEVQAEDHPNVTVTSRIEPYPK